MFCSFRSLVASGFIRFAAHLPHPPLITPSTRTGTICQRLLALLGCSLNGRWPERHIYGAVSASTLRDAL